MGQAEGICLEEVIKRLSDNSMLGEKCETDVRPKYRTPQRRGPLSCGMWVEVGVGRASSGVEREARPFHPARGKGKCKDTKVGSSKFNLDVVTSFQLHSVLGEDRNYVLNTPIFITLHSVWT